MADRRGFRGAIQRLKASLGIAFAQLRRRPLRTVFAILGITLAVLSVTLLGGLGVGVLDFGEQQLDTADRDLWVSAGETRLTTAQGGGFENTLFDSRSVAEDIEGYEGVRHVAPIAFDSVYVDAGDGDFETIIATGVPGTGGGTVSLQEGEHLDSEHYAGGSYDGEMSHEVIIDDRTAERLDVEIGDTLRIGVSTMIAQDHEFTVVGTSSTMSEMLGTATVTLPLAEFHRVTGSVDAEPATFITVTVDDDASVSAVEETIETNHPDLDVRTNREQIEAVLQEQMVVLVAGVMLVVLAVIAGIALTGNLLALLVHQQRRAFAALEAQGCSSRFITGTVVWQGMLLGLLGALFGIALTIPAAALANYAIATLIGFEGIVIIEPWMLVLGGTIAFVIGTVSAAVVGWRAIDHRPLEHLA